jgi:transposase-like protein
MVPKVRPGGDIPFFVTEHKRSEDALSETLYPVIWVDALYEKVHMNGKVVSMAVLVVCGVDEHGQAVEPIAEGFGDSYLLLFQNLKGRGLTTPKLIVSGANAGLVAAIREGFPGPSWQRCKMHFMRNILAHISQKDKQSFAAMLKGIWLTPSVESVCKRAAELIHKYGRRFPKAIQCLEDDLEDSLAFYAFLQLDFRKISPSNMLEWLSKEIRRRTNVVGIFPNKKSYIRLVTTYLMKYAED